MHFWKILHHFQTRFRNPEQEWRNFQNRHPQTTSSFGQNLITFRSWRTVHMFAIISVCLVMLLFNVWWLGANCLYETTCNKIDNDWLNSFYYIYIYIYIYIYGMKLFLLALYPHEWLNFFSETTFFHYEICLGCPNKSCSLKIWA